MVGLVKCLCKDGALLQVFKWLLSTLGCARPRCLVSLDNCQGIIMFDMLPTQLVGRLRPSLSFQSRFCLCSLCMLWLMVPVGPELCKLHVSGYPSMLQIIRVAARTSFQLKFANWNRSHTLIIPAGILRVEVWRHKKYNQQDLSCGRPAVDHPWNHSHSGSA